VVPHGPFFFLMKRRNYGTFCWWIIKNNWKKYVQIEHSVGLLWELFIARLSLYNWNGKFIKAAGVQWRTTGTSGGGGGCPPPWSCGEKITVGELKKEGIFPMLATESTNIVKCFIPLPWIECQSVLTNANVCQFCGSAVRSNGLTALEPSAGPQRNM